MLTCAHKAQLLELAQEKARELVCARRLAVQQLGADHMTTRILSGRVVQANRLIEALEQEPAENRAA